MVSLRSIKTVLAAGFAVFSASSTQSFALDIDWSGQFRTESHILYNYSFDSSGAGVVYDATKYAADGYTIPAGGDRTAVFQLLNLKLRPRIIVNDNLLIKSEWWLLDPAFGLFGNAGGLTADQRTFDSTLLRGTPISVRRLWAEILTDIGTVQVGRAPLHWGLGILWNNGDGTWDRFSSTADVIRIVSKLGAFSFTPMMAIHSIGNSIGGVCGAQFDATGAYTSCLPRSGTGSVIDGSISLKYENADEDFDLGLNFVRRFSSGDQSALITPLGNTDGMNLTTWDVYGRKRLGRFSLAAEVPIVTGNVGPLSRTTFAVATDFGVKITDNWDVGLKIGHAPGTDPAASRGGFANYKTFYFHPSYKVGLLMFNYQYFNFMGPNAQGDSRIPEKSLVSPFDKSIANTTYFSLGGSYRTDRWQFRAAGLYALAAATATTGNFFENTDKRRISTIAAVENQEAGLGWEADLGASFFWDDHFQLDLDLGVYFPGNYYKFSNVAGQQNNVTPMLGSALKASIKF